MVVNRKEKTVFHYIFKDIINFLDKGDHLVLNDTRVILARLKGEKKETHGKVEVFLLKNIEDNKWEVLVKPGRRIRKGTEIEFSNIMNFRGVRVGMSSDGIGTKIELAERTEIYNTIGYDLIAMTADDLAANGMETVNMTNILDVDHLDHDIIDKLMQGLNEAANFAKVVITGGEIAEMGNRVGGYGDKMHFNWCAAGVSMLPEGLDPIDGADVKPGDTVISLKSRGFRSNGYSLLRRIMEDNYGPEWHEHPYCDSTWGEALLVPSLIYTPLIISLRKAGYERLPVGPGQAGRRLHRVLRPRHVDNVQDGPGDGVQAVHLQVGRTHAVGGEEALGRVADGCVAHPQG